MPYRDYECFYCGRVFESLVMSHEHEDYKTQDCTCGSKAELLPALIGGVNGVSLSGARPKNSGAMKKAKVFTGNKPGFVDEPENAQLEFDFGDND